MTSALLLDVLQLVGLYALAMIPIGIAFGVIVHVDDDVPVTVGDFIICYGWSLVPIVNIAVSAVVVVRLLRLCANRISMAFSKLFSMKGKRDGESEMNPVVSCISRILSHRVL